MKVLTVIVPSYNVEDTIDRCLSSLIVASETMSLLEVIVVNDGSSDSTSRIANEYEKKYPDIFSVIDKSNGHYGSCINVGLGKASGKYIKVLDSDDSFDSSCLEEYISFLSGNDSDVVYNGMAVDNGFAFTVDSVDRSGEVLLQSVDEELIKQTFIHKIAYKVSVLKGCSYRQSEGMPYTDLEWTTIPFHNVNTVSFFNQPLYRYSIGRPGQTVSPQVHSKNMHFELDVVRGVISYYCGHRESMNSPSKRFFLIRLGKLASAIYHYYLVVYKRYLSNRKQELESFDSFLRTAVPELDTYLFSYSEKVPIMGKSFHYVKEYRSGCLLSKMKSLCFYSLVSLSEMYHKIKVNK